MQLKVQIARFVDHSFPGFVECELVDARDHLHTFLEKGPIVSDDWHNLENSCPTSGTIRCEILEQWRDPDGRDLMRVTTLRPDAVETKEGVTKFVVLSSQVISVEATIAELEQKVKDCENRAKLDPNRADMELRAAATYGEWIAALKNGRWPT